VKFRRVDDVAEGNCGIGKQAVLESERLVDVWKFDGGTINFKSFDYFSSERSEMSGGGGSGEDVENKDARERVYVVIENNKVIVGGDGVSGGIDGD